MSDRELKWLFERVDEHCKNGIAALEREDWEEEREMHWRSQEALAIYETLNVTPVEPPVLTAQRKLCGWCLRPVEEPEKDARLLTQSAPPVLSRAAIDNLILNYVEPASDSYSDDEFSWIKFGAEILRDAILESLSQEASDE